MKTVNGWRDLGAGLLLSVALLLASMGLLRAMAGSLHHTAHDEELYYPSGRFLREATVGFREVAADYLWFQTVQYYGSYRNGEHDLRYFAGLVDAVTDLDPRFVEAYYFGSLVASMDQNQIPAAVSLLKKGILANPDRWILPFNIGFTYYVLTQDFDRAALWFQIAAEAPDATDFARRFAAFARKRAGNIEGSLALWRNLRETTNNPIMRDLADRMIEDCAQQLRESGTVGQRGRL